MRHGFCGLQAICAASSMRQTPQVADLDAVGPIPAPALVVHGRTEPAPVGQGVFPPRGSERLPRESTGFAVHSGQALIHVIAPQEGGCKVT